MVSQIVAFHFGENGSPYGSLGQNRRVVTLCRLVAECYIVLALVVEGVYLYVRIILGEALIDLRHQLCQLLWGVLRLQRGL